MKRLVILLALVAGVFVAMNVMPATAKVPGGSIENSCAAVVLLVEDAQACGSGGGGYRVSDCFFSTSHLTWMALFWSPTIGYHWAPC